MKSKGTPRRKFQTVVTNAIQKISKTNLDLGRCGLCNGRGMMHHASAPDIKAVVCPSCKGFGRKI